MHFHHCPDHFGRYQCFRVPCDDRPVMYCVRCEDRMIDELKQDLKRKAARAGVKLCAICRAVPRVTLSYCRDCYNRYQRERYATRKDRHE